MALGLAGVMYALTEGQSAGLGSARVIIPGLVGVIALAGFIARERRTAQPMLPLGLFSSLQFSAANVVTFLVYAALAGGLFLLPIELQQASGYSPLRARVALIPMTFALLLLPARAGRLADKIGPRLPMSLGPVIAGLGLILLAGVGAHASYAADVFPGVFVLGLGMALTVAPVTSTVLAAGGEEHAGVSSAVNNDVARVGGLLAVAVIPLAVGLAGSDYRHPASVTSGFQAGVILSGALCVIGGLVAAVTIRRISGPTDESSSASYCALGAPPLRQGRPAKALPPRPALAGDAGHTLLRVADRPDGS